MHVTAACPTSNHFLYGGRHIRLADWNVLSLMYLHCQILAEAVTSMSQVCGSSSVRQDKAWWVVSEVTGGSKYAGHHDERRRSPVQETKPDNDELRCGKGIIELIQCKAEACDRMRCGGSC
ncbi:hypothetical protein J6590_105410 [Homalodisca vitripennis]|nr:hypothetical protein J6590_105410 [Homalodisca vitripennis]